MSAHGSDASSELSAAPQPRPSTLSQFVRSPAGVIGLTVLGAILVMCLGSLPWTLGRSPSGSARYDEQSRTARHLPPVWCARASADGEDRLDQTARHRALEALARERNTTVDDLLHQHIEPTPSQIAAARPTYVLGTDLLGRDLFTRVLAGGGISLTIGIAAAFLSVLLGTLYGSISGYVGGRTDAVMMRIVDILYGLPYILLVVLLAVAVDSVVESAQSRHAADASRARAEHVERALAQLPPTERDQPDVRSSAHDRALAGIGSGELSPATRQAVSLLTLLVAIGGVSWLTMARVIRGQVLSLKARPFMEAARAIGVPLHAQFLRHLLPNLVGPITVYATLTVPQAILQESFLSFLGIGVRPPLPSWGNLAAEGLVELNAYQSHWWLLVFPCLMLGATLLALNFLGEGLREALDPKQVRR